MIVNVRGYSGSGKSTAVKEIIKLYPNHEVLVTRYKRPLVTRLYGNSFNECIVIGPYDDKNQTNGCDVIPYNQQIKLLVEYFANLGYDILLEGMMLSTNHSIITGLASKFPTKVIYLDVSQEQIVLQRKQRAIENGREADFDHATSIMNRGSVEKSLEILKKSIECIHVTNAYDARHVFVTLVESQEPRLISTESPNSRFSMMCDYDTTLSEKSTKKQLPPDLFSIE